jgi:hemerythrin-like domain-containing protein
MSSPLLHAGPAVGWDTPFEMLLACHERVERMLGLLERLAAHLAAHGVDANARQAAQDVLRYFDLAGPAHHEDEERHLFPRLAERGGAAAALAQRLHADHLAMSQQWAVVRGTLQAVVQGTPPDTSAWPAFAALYRSHIAAEEGEAYPAAQALVDDAALRAMGAEMAARRGAR